MRLRMVKMSQQQAPINITSFVKGFITEASPLTFPDGASLDEQNFVLNKDGSRNRRLGMEFSSTFSSTTLSNFVSATYATTCGFKSFLWKNVANTAELNFLVVQLGNSLTIYNVATMSTGPIYTGTLSNQEISSSISAVDGILVITDGSSVIRSYSYSSGTITESSFSLYIRDLFGVEDGYLSHSTIDTRPSSNQDLHVYNLYNQGWAYPRFRGNNETLTDPISSFVVDAGVYPSNSDTVLSALYADANDSDDRITKRFFPADLKANPLGSTRAACGYFIINALTRGADRRSSITSLRSKFSQVAYNPQSMPLDYTDGGFGCLSQYAGRMFYSGISGATISGDAQSPSLGSYVLFSKLVSSTSDLSVCYQEADPTSDNSDLVDTDGGFIKVDGASTVLSMVNLGDSLILIASNGVWQITGGSGYGFSATDYKVARLSDRGCIAKDSVVQVDNSLIFFGTDGIYTVAKDQLGDYAVQNVTIQTIQTYYNDIDDLLKRNAVGFFDGYERKVHWILRNSIGSTSDTTILNFDVDLGAFYKDVVDGSSQVVGYVSMPAFAVTTADDTVYYDTDLVVHDGASVVYGYSALETSYRESYYIGIKTLTSATSGYSAVIDLCQYTNSEFKDWGTADAEAYLLTGYASGNEYQRNKFIPYLSVFFERSETGWDSSYNLLNTSSCLVQSQWEWTNSANSKRWGTSFEAYRLKRPYLPSSSSEEYNDGFPVVSTRNKLRGHGKVVSLLFKTSPSKALKIYGWSMVVNVNGNL